MIDINSIRCFDACLLLPRKHVKLFGWFSRGLWTAADCMRKPGAQALFFFTLSSYVSPYPSVFASVFLCFLHFVLFTPDIKICLGWFDYKCKVKTQSKTFTLHCICSVNSNLIHPTQPLFKMQLSSVNSNVSWVTTFNWSPEKNVQICNIHLNITCKMV